MIKIPIGIIIVFGSLIFDFVRMPQLHDIMGDGDRFQLYVVCTSRFVETIGDLRISQQ